MGDVDKDLLKKITKWFGFVSSVLVLILGFVHVCSSKAYIRFPHHPWKFCDDLALITWKLPLFSLDPNLFFDHWTPMVMGLIGTFIQFEMFGCPQILGSMLKYFIWNMFLGLFGCIGYRGGLGILFSIPVWVTCLLTLICHFICDDNCHLKIPLKVSKPNVGG